ncbi:hypothetical protein NRY95_05625 [Xanthomonas campestris pv. phormiicola]|nr:hypothetical protein [Xanthomonas campestris pv. phormiicola]UYC17443.1 hypothetical protein NRY95_05625 [Xanthomonas campestris pv. phormiicola]
MTLETLLYSLILSQKFSPGRIITTAGVNDLERRCQPRLYLYLHRHLRGDWGDVDDSDWQCNDTALKSGEDRLFSAYEIEPDLRLWIITEWDRSATTLLLPSEY